MIIDTLITDRSAADLARWLELRNKGYDNMTDAERAEWGAGMKGAYNNTDLNRVGEALNYLHDRLAETRYISSSAFSAKVNWTEKEIPSAQAIKDYLSYVSIIRGALAQFPTTPPVPVYSGSLTYQEANNIEKILVDVELLINNMLAARYFCGELFCGEV